MFRIELKPKSSKVLFYILLCIHVLAIAAVCFADIWLIAKISLLSLIAISGYHLFLKNILMHSKNAIVKCVYSDDCWLLFDRQGKEYVAELVGDSLVTPILVILNFRLNGNWRKRSLVLFADALNREIFRQLRVFLLAGCK